MSIPVRIRIRADLCTGCRSCVLACALAHGEPSSLHRANIRVVRDEFVRRTEVPYLCRQCGRAPCIPACPRSALVQENGRVELHLERCDLCGGEPACVQACPFDAIWVSSGRIRKCDMCGGEPACVRFCVTGALRV